MKTESISNTNMQGRIVITNKFSNKPKQCITKALKDIESVVRDNNYILYLTQDYSKNTVNFELKTFYYPNLYHKEELVDTGIVNKIDINSKVSKYIETAKKTIADYKALKQQHSKKEQEVESLQEMVDFCASLALLPIAIVVCGIAEGAKKINNDFKNMFNKAKKLAIKKG